MQAERCLHQNPLLLNAEVSNHSSFDVCGVRSACGVASRGQIGVASAIVKERML